MTLNSHLKQPLLLLLLQLVKLVLLQQLLVFV
jgi:hypothetical protein